MMLPPDSHPSVLVVGDLMLDHYLWGETHRISPEAPVPVVDVKKETTVLGGAGNVMNNLLALGANVYALAVIGDDESGRELKEKLDGSGVNTAGVLVENGRLTSKKTRIVATHQQMLRFDKETRTDIREETLPLLRERFSALTPTFTQWMIAEAKARNIPVLVDPKGTDYSKYRGATLVTPNKKEAQEATGITIDDNVSLQLAGDELRNSLELQSAIITLSEAGMAIFDAAGSHRITAKAREVFDVTGAGDTVLAALGMAMASGMSVHDAAAFANTAAAVVVGKLGSATVTPEEIVTYEQSLMLSEASAILSREEMGRKAKVLREQGKKIVFTNGCFDLLHRGHVEYLKASRSLGDLLIVGLNSDESVRQLKGPERPINSEEDRAVILTALESVDYVVIFHEETPYELIRAIGPDVLTKGKDYEGKTVVGSDIAKEVQLITFVEGRSTTATIQKISTKETASC